MNKQKTATAVIADADMKYLAELAGVKPSAVSPLGSISGARSGPDAAGLQRLGLLESARPARLAATVQKALEVLAAPVIELRLAWGSPDRANFSTAYSAGQDELVVFTRDGDRGVHFSPAVSSGDVTDLAADTLLFAGLKKEVPELSVEADAAGLPVLMAVLDLYREAELRATLERTAVAPVSCALQDVLRVLQDGRLDGALGWYAPVGDLVFDYGTAIDEAGVTRGLAALRGAGIIASSKGMTVLSDGLNAFAHRAYPIAGYFGITVTRLSGTTMEISRAGLIRSLGTLLLIQPVPEGTTGRFMAHSISTSDVPELLVSIYNQAFSDAAEPPTPGGIVCPSCRTVNPAGANFCNKCGTTFKASSAAPVCRSCGAEVVPGRKFCIKCGSPV